MNESERAVGDRHRLTFDAFCDTHHRTWTGFAAARLGDPGAAHGAVELAKGRVWQEWPRILREQFPAFQAWTILKEEVGAALLRRTMNGEPPPSPAHVPLWVCAVRAAAERAGDLPETAADHWQLYAALRGLSERRHDVVLLRHLLGLTDRQIADCLATTEANVRSTAAQALDRLAAALGVRNRERR
ncbi:DNA-directed RNA polymerase specialized sigma24 family protein [Kitasatospora sp. SolWspMP-SS2h]|uniref:sigma factor-like helix-turn-helix DNA-binding protein n=1 Tax=Kitasatospora sp. SolWspMP-SS2h TaxID=1305729 RepID=UPI000DBA2012|nr:sigma factor-like helix-turn-helix DNA-binding protein [Kitasatospora sp. SolWspMP-SS2h]RAJ47053.1 DNA-directed RNA polymerase specialized sigma24 family protein [Kitasatospora sp. SolWspMP-SS2h]